MLHLRIILKAILYILDRIKAAFSVRGFQSEIIVIVGTDLPPRHENYWLLKVASGTFWFVRPKMIYSAFLVVTFRNADILRNTRVPCSRYDS
jgi:hypothetical protein